MSDDDAASGAAFDNDLSPQPKPGCGADRTRQALGGGGSGTSVSDAGTWSETRSTRPGCQAGIEVTWIALTFIVSAHGPIIRQTGASGESLSGIE